MPDIIEQLKLHEGVKLEPYEDTEGYQTIGIGRNLDSKGITEEEAIYMLENDVEQVVSQLQGYEWFNKLDTIRQKVIVDMAFNLGVNGLLSFKNMIQAIKENNYHEASQEMLDSRWAEQVGQRANRLSEMMETGEDYK